MSEVDYQKRNETHELFIPVGERLGDKVIEFNEVSKGFGDRLLIDKLSFSVPPGAIVGIIGPNGAGKSTLFKMLTGQDKPDSGNIDVGPTVKISYVDQSRDCLDGSKTVFDELAGGADIITIGKQEIGSRAYIGRFNFKGGDQQKNVGNLSGGERGRLHLAKTLMTGGNVLLLDEPSNDLDVETLRALEDALLEFAGCAMIISHDRWFLDRICTHILACRGRFAMELLRRQLPGIRGRQEEAPRRGRRQAEAHPLQADHALRAIDAGSLFRKRLDRPAQRQAGAQHRRQPGRAGGHARASSQDRPPRNRHPQIHPQRRRPPARGVAAAGHAGLHPRRQPR
jgi:ATPase subunit of ABC transporter with duplicated ATPase domains